MDQMFLVITLRREVPDKPAAKTMVQIVKNKLADHPEVSIKSHTTDHYDLEDHLP